MRRVELTPNQPMERTLPRCALQRRSSARYTSDTKTFEALRPQNLTNLVQARHRHAAFEMGFALHFLGAHHDDRESIERKNEVS